MLFLALLALVLRGPASPHPVPPPSIVRSEMPAPVCEPGKPCCLHGTCGGGGGGTGGGGAGGGW